MTLARAIPTVILAAVAAMLALAVTPDRSPAERNVRVEIQVQLPASAHAAAIKPETRRALQGHLGSYEQRILTSPYAGDARRGAIARLQERRRQHALRSLRPAVLRASRGLNRVADTIERRGARILEVDPLNSTVTATVAESRLAGLRHLPGIRRVAPALAPQPLASTVSPWAVGADVMWAAGHTGGEGTSDGAAPDIAMFSDKIQEDHPAFAGVTFLRPPDAPLNTLCGDTASLSCDHGTEVASMAIAQGITSCPVAEGYTCDTSEMVNGADRKGSSPGVDRVLDTQLFTATGTNPENYTEASWVLGLPQAGRSTGTVLAGASDAAEIANYSRGSMTEGYDENESSVSFDNIISSFGLPITTPIGNDGPSGGPSTPCIGFNTICVGAFITDNTRDNSDDYIPNWVSRGPSAGGRKKPDLVAVGGSALANRRWRTTGHLYTGGTGTSYSAPQVAGGVALLMAAGISDRLAVKAILIDSARQGRSGAGTSTAMGTQSGWQPDWGWGAMDMGRALSERSNFATSTVGPNSARFFAAATQAAGDRATLVWERHASGCIGCLVTGYPLSNLDLTEYPAGGGAARTSSTSAIDNVEQTRTPGAASVIYKVSSSDFSVVPSEAFAVAAANPLTPLETPTPDVAVALGDQVITQGQDITITATFTNPSGDLGATVKPGSVQPVLPAGVTVVGDGGEAVPSSIAPNGSFTHTWTVRGNADVDGQAGATATFTAYGSDLTGRDTDTLRVDSTGPAAATSAPAGERTDTAIPVSWSATDGAGVSSYDVDVATDGGAFTNWLTDTGFTGAVFGGTAGHSYVFRARGTDTLGNAGGYATSGTVTVKSSPVDPGPRPGPDPDPIPVDRRLDPRLKVVSAKLDRTRRYLTIYGQSLAKAGIRATFSFSAKVSGRRVTQTKTRILQLGTGKGSVRIKLSSRARSFKTATVTVAYGGDRTSWKASDAARSVRRSSPRSSRLVLR
jgi:Subtilase family